jgi:hypothetical protein
MSGGAKVPSVRAFSPKLWTALDQYGLKKHPDHEVRPSRIGADFAVALSSRATPSSNKPRLALAQHACL